MTGESRISLRPGAALAVALALLAVGGGVAYLVIRVGRAAPAGEPAVSARIASAGVPREPPAAPAAPASSIRGTPTAPAERLADVVVPITADAVRRAGIANTAVSARAASTAIRIPGVVESNAYRQVAVTSLVTGRVTAVTADLGQHVRSGQTMAQIYSPELAEAQTRYLSARAELDAHDRALQRTQRLVAIGAASQQELERAHAEHAAQVANVQSVRTKLELFGVRGAALDGLIPGKEVDAMTTLPAPMDGVVTERVVNVGLNVDPTMKLFTVVDLSTVWVLADLYEKDLARVQVGSQVTVTTGAYPDRALRGRVGYIDPQLSRDTRTARVRVEVENPRGELRLGMYADVLVGTDQRRDVIVVPRGAVQNVGDRAVVYLPNPSGGFVEREVSVGRLSGDDVEIESGLQAGDVVASRGSFFIRAERERLGLRAGVNGTTGPAPDVAMAQSPTTTQTAAITVTPGGFEPSSLTLRAGVPARVTFTRTTNETCAIAVVFPSLKLRRDLPLNQPVAIEFTPAKGEVAFACGMNMFKGAIVVQ